MPVPSQNPVTPEKAILGKLLFWEEQLSTDNRVACGTCHTFAAGGGDTRRRRMAGVDGVFNTADDVFASPGIRRSDANNDYLPDPVVGFATQVTDRSSPTFLTAAWFTDLFWDGRASGTFLDPDSGSVLIPSGGALESQSMGPPLSPVEMAHDMRTFAQLTGKLADSKPMALATNLPSDMAAAIAGGVTYPDLFQTAFGTPDVTAARIAYAIATYERTLVPDQTPYDAFVAGNTNALSAQERQGLNVFMGPGRCNLCHTSGLFSDDRFHNLGLRPISEDNGRQGVTGSVADAGRFKTPSLRNVGLRNTFMHNGEFTSLQEVVLFYVQGGGPNQQNKDPLLQPLQQNVPPPAGAALAQFLATGLTDPRVASGLPPFDRPTLRRQLLPEAGVQSGIPTLGSGNQVTQILAGVPANIGNPDFKIGVYGALGGSTGVLAVGTAAGSSQINGVNVNVDLNGAILMPYMLQGTPGVAGDGWASVRTPLPDDPGLIGISVYPQWFVWDNGTAGGASASRAARVDIF
ncbi:MAG: cytochrome-c peroxidase [Planctomycetota bacterium]